MGMVAVKIKIMPESPETELGKVEENIMELMKKNDVKNPKFGIQPVAFGLKALIVLFVWPEEKEFEEFEKDIQEIKGVSSTEILDMRRAIG